MRIRKLEKRVVIYNPMCGSKVREKRNDLMSPTEAKRRLMTCASISELHMI